MNAAFGAHPRIAVVVPLVVPGASAAVHAIVNRFTASALHMLSTAGAEPWVVDTSASTRPAPERVASADGVLLLGGGDMDPTLYGVTTPVPGLYGVDRAGDLHALDIVHASRSAATPVLGVCRGSQVLNVALGGTLLPHLEDSGLHRNMADGSFVDEKITLNPDSWVSAILKATSATVRSGHHQAIAQPGEGLHAIAWGNDGVIEGIEHATWWAKGVQWHPEDPDGNQQQGAQLFHAYLSAITHRTLSQANPP